MEQEGHQGESTRPGGTEWLGLLKFVNRIAYEGHAKGERRAGRARTARDKAERSGSLFPKGAGRQPGTDVEDRKKESGHTMRVNKRRGDVGKKYITSPVCGNPLRKLSSG